MLESKLQKSLSIQNRKGAKMKGFSIRKSNYPDPLVEGYDLEDRQQGSYLMTYVDVEEDEK